MGRGSDSYHSVNPSKYREITLRWRKICDDPLERLNVNVDGNHDFFYSFSSFIKEPGLLGRNWIRWRWSFLWLGCHLTQRVNRVKTIYMELGSWARGYGSWLQVLEDAAELAPEGLERSCWGDGSRKMVPVCYGAGKELNMTGWLVCSWCRGCAPLVLGSACWQKLVKLMSTNPMLIGTAPGVGRWAYCVQGCSISDFWAVIVRYQVSCLSSCCRRTLLLDDVHFQAPGRLFAGRGPRQFMHTPV